MLLKLYGISKLPVVWLLAESNKTVEKFVFVKSASFEQVSIDMAPTVIMDIARGKATKEQIIILVLRVQLSMALKRRLVHVKIKSFFQTVAPLFLWDKNERKNCQSF